MVLIIVLTIELRITVLLRRVKILFIEIRNRFHAPVLSRRVRILFIEIRNRFLAPLSRRMKAKMKNQRIKQAGQKLREMADNFSASVKPSKLTPNVSFWNRNWKFMFWLTAVTGIALLFIFRRLYQDAT